MLLLLLLTDQEQVMGAVSLPEGRWRLLALFLMLFGQVDPASGLGDIDVGQILIVHDYDAIELALEGLMVRLDGRLLLDSDVGLRRPAHHNLLLVIS